MFKRLTCGFALCAALAGCIRDDDGSCPPAVETVETREMFVVRVTDLMTGEDITSSGGVRNAILVVFDESGNYVARIDVASENIGREMELPSELRTRASGERLQVSAWGNIGTNIAFQEDIGAGHALTSQFLDLKVNTEYADNWYNPGDVFFGLSTITPGESRLHTIEVMQKTARMAVSVRGLPAGESADDYYFSMCEQNDGFTFDGTPLRTNEWCKIRENGVFDSSGTFTTEKPYYVIPSTDPSDVSACDAGVCLYKVGGGLTSRTDASAQAHTSDEAGYITEYGDLNITGKAKVDVDGNHIALLPGQTTNVLMTFTSTGDLEIKVKMTAWDEIYQWSSW